MAHINISDLEVIARILDNDPVRAVVKFDMGEDLDGVSLRVREAMDNVATPAVREAAKEKWETDDLEIDDDAGRTETADGQGLWVQAWVFVPFPDCETCDGHSKDENDEPCPDCGGSGKGTI